MKRGKSQMKKLQRDLKAILKTIYSLAQKVEKMQKEVDNKIKTNKKQKPKAVKKAPTNKVVVRKTAPASAADKIFAIIKRSKGVNIETLMNKTGYERKAVYNVIYKLTKQGKIKTVTKGVYVKA